MFSVESLEKDSVEYNKFNWLGLFSDKECKINNATPAQILQEITEKKLSLDNEDKDMVVMQHQFEYLINNKKQKLNSSLVVFGDDQRNTAMAKTVGLPVAIAVKLILNNTIQNDNTLVFGYEYINFYQHLILFVSFLIKHCA